MQCEHKPWEASECWNDDLDAEDMDALDLIESLIQCPPSPPPPLPPTLPPLHNPRYTQSAGASRKQQRSITAHQTNKAVKLTGDEPDDARDDGDDDQPIRPSRPPQTTEQLERYAQVRKQITELPRNEGGLLPPQPGELNSNSAEVSLDETQLHIVEQILADRNLFVSGKAGVGKSQTLRAAVKSLRARNRVVFVTAFNGVAAAHAGGITLHNFAGLKPADIPPFMPGNSDARLRVLNCNTLIIDEISCVPYHWLEGLDYMFRKVRQVPDRVFGGAQVCVFGDFAQLPPVMKRPERGKPPHPTSKLRVDAATGERFYNNTNVSEIMSTPPSPYARGEDVFCFVAKCWSCFSPYLLEKQYRQNRDAAYATILNQVRDMSLSTESKQLLNKRSMQYLQCSQLTAPELDEDGMPVGYVMLCPYKKTVKDRNTARLASIKDDVGYRYKADDCVPLEVNRPLLASLAAPEIVEVKVGAQVLLKRNLSKTLVNGSRGIVIGYTEVYARDLYCCGVGRPIRGCVFNRSSSTDTPPSQVLSTSYRLPLDENHRPYTVDPLSVYATEIDPETVCNRQILYMADAEADRLQEHQVVTGGAAYYSKPVRMDRFELISQERINALHQQEFYPLPVVLFDPVNGGDTNGLKEVAVVGPVEWSVEHPVHIQKKVSVPSEVPGQPDKTEVREWYEVQKVVGRIQIPLILGWAITIHSSQGLTIGRLCVDLQGLFASGQAYVALSRGVELSNLLITDVNYNKFFTDKRVLAFYADIAAGIRARILEELREKYERQREARLMIEQQQQPPPSQQAPSE